MGLWEIAPELDKWLDNNALANETIETDAVEKKLVELVQETERLKDALREIVNEKEIHTKLNQERLCCRFQSIAMEALDMN